MNHVLYGFIAGFRNRGPLAAILRGSRDGTTAVAVSPEELQQRGMRALALDFDGVLAPHGRPEPLPEAAEWLSRCCNAFGEDRIFILSNKPTPERKAWFERHHPQIRFIAGVRKKPYPDGLENIIRLAGVQPHELTILDDRLLTGVLAACLAGTDVVYITAPCIDLSGNRLAEAFFIILRAVERMLVRLA